MPANGQLRHHEPPRHPDRVEHRAVVGEQRREHRGADRETRPPGPPRRTSRRPSPATPPIWRGRSHPRRVRHPPTTAPRWPANPAPAQGNSTAAAPPGGRPAPLRRTGRPPPPADTKQAWKAMVRNTRSRPITTCARSTETSSAQRNTAPASSARQNNTAASHCPTRLATAEPASSSRGSAQPAVHEQRTQHRRQAEPDQHIAQRPHGVLHPPHPAVAGRRHQDRRHAEDRDAHPWHRGGGDARAGSRARDHATPAAPRPTAPPRRSTRPRPSASQVACTPSPTAAARSPAP